MRTMRFYLATRKKEAPSGDKCDDEDIINTAFSDTADGHVDDDILPDLQIFDNNDEESNNTYYYYEEGIVVPFGTRVSDAGTTSRVSVSATSTANIPSNFTLAITPSPGNGDWSDDEIRFGPMLDVQNVSLQMTLPVKTLYD
ncbi:hypothetical protein SNE40_011215 [Patella caerulea]|uniref:Uncharacterized protein n=1 Tax=Patella caerulea TaxID=87958 RepID=A0AAN8JN66_PATCE